MATSIFSVISAISGTLISANGIALACGNAKNIGTYLTIALGVILILISIFRKLVKKLFIYPLFKLLSVLACIALVVGIISSVALCIYGNADTATYEEDYLIVLGCGLNGSTPSESLVKRLDKAIEYSSRNTDCKIIVTGGQGSGEDVSEAEAMYIYLVENGINPERIIREDASTSTTENFEFSNNIT
ncbi:MAG: YdcF family protein, partial [Clostridia bacterium]|nr:YdcF family protein [Clostridia bacterium]